LKATEVLESTRWADPITAIYGEDLVLRKMVTDHIQRLLRRGKEDTERLEVASVQAVLSTIDEGSLFGSRLLIIDVAKWQGIKLLESKLPSLRETGDQVIIRGDKLVDGINVRWIECNPISNKKSRKKLVGILMATRGMTTTEEGLEKITERCETTSEIESTLLLLSFVIHGNEVRLQDIEQATSEPEHRRDLTRAVLHGNTIRLAKEINTGDPIPTLAILQSVLLKLYTFIESTSDEEDDQDNTLAETLKIQGRFVKEWRSAKKKYAPRVVREIMNEVKTAYDAVRSGRGQGWKERLQFVLTRLGS
jgi:DNA polymerase III delta subunit